MGVWEAVRSTAALWRNSAEFYWAGEGSSRTGCSLWSMSSLLKQCGLTAPRGEAAETTNGQWGWLQHDRRFHSTEGNIWLGRLLRLWPISHKPNLPWHCNQPLLQGCSLQCSPISLPAAQIPVIEKTCGSQSGSVWQPTGFCLMKVSKLSACSFPVGLKTHTAMVQGVINYLEYSAI